MQQDSYQEPNIQLELSSSGSHITGLDVGARKDLTFLAQLNEELHLLAT